MTPAQEQHLAQLLVSAQDGDETAYREYLSRSAVFLRAYVTRRLPRAESVEDVVQEALLSIHTARHTFTPGKPVVPWMLAIVKHRLYDHLRRWVKGESHEILDSDWGERMPSPSGGSDSMSNLMVREALAQLPPTQREVLGLLKWDGLTTAEVSRRLQMSEPAVRVTAHRAYEGVKKYLLSAVYENG